MPAPPPPLTCHAACTPGVERLLAAEVSRLGGEIVEQEHGGLSFTTDLAGLYHLHLHGRLASRVVVRVARFRARALPELFRRARAVAWEQWLPAGATVTVRAASHRSRLYHTGAVAERVAAAVAARLGPPAEEEATSPSHLLLARLEANQCTLSLDASGELLHRRGYRLASGPAPLRETLACAVLQLAGWRPELPLLDPMCGAGTFAIEAARWALGIPPGTARDFAFQRWRNHDAALWERLLAEARVRCRATLPAPVVALDRDPKAVAAARANAERAGVADALVLHRGDLFDHRPEGPAGVVVLDPPYGRRIGGPDTPGLYRKIGAHLRAHFPGWRYALLCPTPRLAHTTGLTGKRHRLTHGGKRVVLVAGRL